MGDAEIVLLQIGNGHVGTCVFKVNASRISQMVQELGIYIYIYIYIYVYM